MAQGKVGWEGVVRALLEWFGEQDASDKAWAAKLEVQHNKWLKIGCAAMPQSAPTALWQVVRMVRKRPVSSLAQPGGSTVCCTHLCASTRMHLKLLSVAPTAHLFVCLQERSQLEASAAAQVSAAEAAAAAASQTLRAKLEGRIASITACLAQLTAQEEAREAKRQELAAQVMSTAHRPGCSAVPVVITVKAGAPAPG